MDGVKEDMRTAGVTEEDAHNRARWKRTIRTGDPRDGNKACRRKEEEEEESMHEFIHSKTTFRMF